MLRELRHRYVDRIAAHVKTVAEHGWSKRDREELQRGFEEDMRYDLANLRGELGKAKRENFFSPQMMATVVLSGAVLSYAAGLPIDLILRLSGATASAGLTAVGGLLAVKSKYASARRSIIDKHPMAYIYELEQSL